MDPALPSPARPAYEVVGRYAIFAEIASGGMAAVHLGKLVGEGGFSRVVAVKRLHPQFAKDAEFSAMFMDEARLAARIRHANVAQTLDVVTAEKELLLVMEYVHGVSFASLLHGSRKAQRRVEPRVVAAVVAGALEGLHAAHEARNEVGAPLGVVHRDVSPQNVLVGADGVPRLIDFGVAKAVGKMHATREGQLKGKLAYMSPEQVRSEEVTRQSDVFSAGLVLWEALMGQRLFDGNNPAELVMQVLSEPIPPPRSRFPDLPQALEVVVMKALCREPRERYATAAEMAIDLEAAVGLASPREVARWAEGLAGQVLEARSQLLQRIERTAALEAGGADPARWRSPAPGYDGGRLPVPPGPAGLVSETRARPHVPLRSDAPPGGHDPTWPQAGAPVPEAEPKDAGRSPRAPDPAASPPPARTPAAPDPADPYAGGLASPRAVAPRVHRIPAPTGTGEPQVSLRERLESPLMVVAVGVLLSVADPLFRPFLGDFPVRPLWIAEILVVVGVLWALARLVLPVKSR